MPFSKYIIETGKTEDNHVLYDIYGRKYDLEDNGIANQRMVNAIRHMSQLMNIADDIFGAIEIEIRDIYNRTLKLNKKIQHCQDIVDNLNAKTVKVPIGSLSDTQATFLHFKSSNVEKFDNASIFSNIPRSIAVEKLRDLADGPTSPVIIPCGMVASQVDGFIGGSLSSSDSSSTSTHIYCKPVKIKDAVKSRNVESDLNGQKKDTDSEKMHSSVVPIDVSGQTFSRMASFRRSLIHVDFLIRRKRKRDKRRNTVSEGSVKDLKEALEKSVSYENKFTVPNDINSYQHIDTESKNEHNYKINENEANDKNLIEENNNADYVKSVKINTHINSIDDEIILGEKNALNSERLKREPKPTDSEFVCKQLSSNKRKPKSHIPISTVSAAMNVAVEMRQYNGVKKEFYNSDHDNFDSDNKLQEDKRYSNSSNNEESSQDESWTDYKKRFHDKYRSLADKKDHNRSNLTDIETEISSSASSENIDPQDTGATTSTESDTFFISSDESEEESSEVIYFHENCGSSTSVGTASDGSLNSLLSETGTEMTSSTGTLTSVGREYLLTPPPPPPPMIISATVNDKNLIERFSDSSCIEHNIEIVKNKKNSRTDISQKQSKQVKLPKSPKSESVVSPKNSSDNAKNIFTSLVNLKSHAKNKSKKDTEKKKMDKISNHPAFDMYGSNSPVKTKQKPAFIKQNYSPVIQKQEKSHMVSFLVSDKSKPITQFSDNEDIDKYKTDLKLSRNNTSDSPDISDITKIRETQTINSIPLKYEHHVTVTPVQRCSYIEQKNMHQKISFIPEKNQNSQHGNLTKTSNINVENPVLIPQIHRPNTPVASQQQERSKLAARVVLDFNGKVIYTTNSLDRSNHPPCHTVNMYNSAQKKTCDAYLKDQQSNHYYDSYQENDLEQKMHTNPISTFGSNTLNVQGNASFNHIKYNDKYRNSDLNTKNQVYEHEYLSPNIKSQHSYRSENSKMCMLKKSDIRPFSYAGPNTLDSYFDNPSNNLLPNPNISGLPMQQSMLTRHNVNLHSKQMEKMNMSSPECKSFRLSDSFCATPTSQTSCGSLLNKSPQSTMSTEDLFAVIHDCKKRMNIKTDSDISLASSSRSCSPSYLRPSSSKGTLAETGFLSPRSQVHLETSGDRRSWADFRPVDSVCYERKSLASDRLGPTKPTSMHDFKMLLLQTRTSSQTSGQRKSAVEMLKLPLNQNNRNTIASLSLNLSPRSSVSVSSYNSPTYELNVSNGHSTVPFKRGNRVRTSLQSRYIMYPPIFEDCSEDSEHCGDMILNKTVNVSNIENVNEKEHTDSKHNIINNNRCMQNHQEYSCDNTINAQIK